MRIFIKTFFAACLSLTLIVGFTACSKKSQTANAQEATIAEMNRALMTWGMLHLGPGPAQVNDLTNSPVLKGKIIPTPPPGKKYTIDFAKGQVVLVDQ